MDGTTQVRQFKIEGDTLRIRSMPAKDFWTADHLRDACVDQSSITETLHTRRTRLALCHHIEGHDPDTFHAARASHEAGSRLISLKHNLRVCKAPLPHLNSGIALPANVARGVHLATC